MKTTLLPLLLLATPLRAEPLAERVDALAAPHVRSGAIVGMVVGVRDANGEEVVRGYGDSGPTADTLYEIGSVTKVFTGVLLAALVRDGGASLDTPVEELLPPGSRMPAGGERKITLVDLSTHTSGLPRMPDNFAPGDPANPFADYTEEKLLAFLAAAKPARAPGVAYEYSNVGAGLLGWAIARKAGKSYEAYLAQEITGPLSMKSTVVALTPETKARLAPGHDMEGRPQANWDLDSLAGAGGIRSTVADMMLFLKANLAGGKRPIDVALAAAREVRYAAAVPGAQRLGLGWHISPPGVHWHNGQTGGYHSFAAVDTAGGRAVVVLADTATGDVDELGEDLLRMLAGLKVEKITVKPEILAEYAGTYAIVPQFKLVVTVERGRLMVQATGQPKFPVYPKSDVEFFYKVVDARLTFERDAEGKVSRVILHQNGRQMPALRE